MTASGNSVPVRIKSWIEQSIWLDLAYDEENPGLAGKVQLLPQKHGNVSRRLSRIVKRLGKKPSERVWAELRDLPMPDLTPPPSRRADTCRWYSYFLALKALRVLDGVRCEQVWSTYAEALVSAHGDGGFSLDGRSDLKEKQSRRLDSIAARCISAVDTLTLRCPAGTAISASGAAERHTQDSQEWATLIALFHSEACASARPELSFGLARGFDVFLREKPIPKAVREFFELTALHNVARGWNHMGRSLEAVRAIDNRVVDAFLFSDPTTAANDTLTRLIELVGESLLRRVLVIPATATLAQGLGDLDRHSERRYYLERAYCRAKGLDYWQCFFSTELTIEELDVGRIPDQVYAVPDEPRLKALYHVANCLRVRVELSGIEPEHQDDTSCGAPDWTDWSASHRWLLGWHSASPGALGERVKTMADDIKFMCRLLGLRAKTQAGDGFRDSARDTLGWTRELVCRLALGSSRSYLRFLVPEDRTNEDCPGRYRYGLWLQTAALYEALLQLEDEQHPKKLQEWRCHLEDVMGRENWFREWRSEAEYLERLRKPRLKPADNRRCLAVELGCTWNQDRQRLCGDHGCAQQLLCSSEQSTPDTAAQENRKCRASPDYFFHQMARQQERFLSFLQHRTGRERSFSDGAPRVRTPDFELICLRRWNSFSPNLGSRVSATVGGGYIVRLWFDSSEDPGRYLGIAIDPGYNFLENLFNEGLTVADIDLVLLTHAHPDHTENLTNIFTLLRERSKRMRKACDGNHWDNRIQPRDHRVVLALTEGVFQRYGDHLRTEVDFIRDIAVLKADGTRGCQAGEMTLGLMVKHNRCEMKLLDLNESDTSDDCLATVRAACAWHHDGTEHDAIGVVIEYRDNKRQDGRGPRIGVLSDTRYDSDLYRPYSECDVVVAHMGGMLDEKQYARYHLEKRELPFKKWLAHLCRSCADDECSAQAGVCSAAHLRRLMEEKNHLYLPGFMRLVCDFREEAIKCKGGRFPLMVLSEFGEELRGGLRVDLAKQISDHFAIPNGQSALPIIPADVGLRVAIAEQPEILCCVCHRYQPFEEMEARSVLPAEEALAYVCMDCRSTRGSELPKLLEEWCTTGRPVVPLGSQPR